MRQLLPVVLVVVVGVGVAACGGGSGRAGVASGTSGLMAVHPRDSDNDNDNPVNSSHDADDNVGQPATAADSSAVAAVVRRYYAAAVRGDGAKACSLLFAPFEETVAKEYGQTPGMRGTTCAAVSSKLFKVDHRQLAKMAAPKIIEVLVDGERGWALFDLGPANERRMLVHREGSGWKVGTLLDSSVP